MVTDARIATGLPEHPKTKKLIRRLGQAAAWNLVRLILWTAVNRSDGDLTGMSHEDIELAADWQGEEGVFVKTLADVRFLDEVDGVCRMHDWSEHNPWAAGSERRSEKASWAALCKQYGRSEAARMMPEYAARLAGARSKDAGGAPDALPEGATSTQVALPETASGTQDAEVSSAPSPSPSPSPSPKKKTSMGGKPPEDALPAGFVRFWSLYPRSKRKEAKGECEKLWRQRGYEDIADTVLEHLQARISRTDWMKQNCQYVEAPIVYLRGRPWEGAELTLTSGTATLAVHKPGTDAYFAEHRHAQWWKDAGFANVYEAHNGMCWHHNAHQFRDGRKVPRDEEAHA